MIVTLKTLQQQTFKIELDGEETVKVLKEKIEKEKGADVFPANGQKLIYAGKILDDDKTVGSYKIEEKNFVVVMVTKPKAAAPPASAPAPAADKAPTPAPAPVAAPEAPKSTPSLTETSTSEETLATASTTTASDSTVSVTGIESMVTETSSETSQTSEASGMSSVSAESALVTGQDYEVIVNRIVNMGFTKEDVQRALRASFNNPDRAVEYLIGGIPDIPPEAPPEPVPESQPPGAQSPSRPAPALPAATQPPQSPATQAGTTPPAQSAGTGVGSLSGMGTGGIPAGGSGEDVLAFLRSQPQFQHMRTLIQNRPELLPELLQQIGHANPQLLQMISENQEQFIGMLNEQEEGGETAQGGGGGGGSGGGTAPGAGQPGGGYIRITQQEKEAIERLKALGFSEGMCIQAYFACEKNEELAANYLLTHGEDDES